MPLRNIELPQSDRQETKISDIWKHEAEENEVNKDELSFDPKKNITEEDWGKISEYLQFAKDQPIKSMKEIERGRWKRFAKIFGMSKLLNNKFEFDIDDIRKKEIIDSGYWDNDVEFILANKILEWNELKIPDEKRIKLQNQLADNNIGKISCASSVYDLYEIVTTLKLCGVKANIMENDEGAKDLKNGMLQIQKSSGNHAEPLFRLVAQWRIFSGEMPIKLTKEDWQEAKEKLDEYRKDGNISLFFEHAFYMKILAAEKVEVTEEGLKITMPEKKPPIKQTPPPTRREF